LSKAVAQKEEQKEQKDARPKKSVLDRLSPEEVRLLLNSEAEKPIKKNKKQLEKEMKEARKLKRAKAKMLKQGLGDD